MDEGVRLAAQTQTVIEQVALAMEHINQATSQGLTSTQQTERAARELNELAQGLIDIVEQYRLT